MDNPFLIAWIVAGVIASFIFIAMIKAEGSDTTLDEDLEFGGGNGCLIVVGGLGGFISLVAVIIFSIMMYREKQQFKKEDELAEKKRKERAAAKEKSAHNVMLQISLAQTEEYSNSGSYFTQATILNSCTPDSSTSNDIERSDPILSSFETKLMSKL